MQSTFVVYLNRQDTIDTVREILAQCPAGSQVWLVVPWRMWLARSLVNLKLLHRLAESEALDLRLVAAYSGTRTLAREAHLPVYLSVPPKLRRYRYPRDKAPKALRERAIPVQTRLGARYERRPRLAGAGAVALTLLVVLTLLAVMAGVAVTLVPSATVVLSPVAKPVEATFDVKADVDYVEVDYTKKVIPARAVEVTVDGRSETPASGRVDMADGHATGEVVLVNRTQNPVTVPKGTVVRTSSGTSVRYLTLADVEVPATTSGSARVGIMAVDAGTSGNVLALTINQVEGDAATLVDVLNDAPTEGGSVKRVPVVAAEDFDRLRAQLADQLQSEAYAQLVAGLSAGEFIPSATLEVEIESQTFDQVIGTQSEVLSMSMRVVARGIAVDGVGLRDLAAQVLMDDQGEGVAIIEDSVIAEPSGEMRTGDGFVLFGAKASGEVGPALDESSISRGLAGKSVAQAQEWLVGQAQLRSEPDITIEPDWWERLPWFPGRIEIVVSSGAS